MTDTAQTIELSVNLDMPLAAPLAQAFAQHVGSPVVLEDLGLLGLEPGTFLNGVIAP